MKKSAYWLLKGVATVLSVLPWWMLYALSGAGYVVLYHVVRYRRRVVRGNISTSFSDMSAADVRRTERQFYRWLCDYAVETLKLLTIGNKALLRHIEFRGVEQMEQVFDEGRNCAAILGHYCNWELLSATGLAFHRYTEAVMGLIYHPLYNDAFNRLFIDIRSAHGGECVPKEDILRRLITLRRDHRRSLFGYISDQAPKWENMHLWLEFLNHDTPVFTGGERIMRKMNDAVFYVDMERTRRGHYVCTFREVCHEAASTAEFDITRRFFQMLEQSIRRQPAYYLWTHNRWKRTREEFNRKYDIIDGRIVRKPNT